MSEGFRSPKKKCRVIKRVLVFDKEVVSHMRMHRRWEDQTARKINFLIKWLVSWICKTLVVTNILGKGVFNGHVARRIENFEGAHGEYGIGEKNVEGRRGLGFCDKKKSCVLPTHCLKKATKENNMKYGWKLN